MKKILGTPMIGHVYNRSKRSKLLNEVYVATCDNEIAEYVQSINGEVIMTSIKHERASDRTAEAQRIEETWEGTLDPIFSDRITINNVNFSYQTQSVLKNVSLVIPKNSFIALMGESGGGKTTFCDILCALFTPDSGEIKVDGKNLHLLDIKNCGK